MSELFGMGAALLGSLLGGTAAAGTRYAVSAIDPLGLATLRYAIGALCLVPFALYSLRKLENSRDLLAIVGLGVMFFALYPFLFALSLVHTTAARGSLVLSTMPLLTLAFAVLLRRESFSWSRLVGILLAVGGLAYALSPRLDGTGLAASRGDLIMIAATCVQALYNVLSRPYIQRIGPLSFTALAMCVGALVLVAFSAGSGVLQELPGLRGAAWAAILYLGLFGCALLWVLWSIGIHFTSPSLVAMTVTVNALTASFLGALFLSEPVGHEFIIGLVAVSLGIAVATNMLASTRSRNHILSS